MAICYELKILKEIKELEELQTYWLDKSFSDSSTNTEYYKFVLELIEECISNSKKSFQASIKWLKD